MGNGSDNENLVEIKNLKKNFPVGGGMFSSGHAVVKAVDDVSFAIKRGETFGLVGESGCGKTTTGRCILRLIEPTSGELFFDGRDMLTLNTGELRELRRDMQIIFQDPYSSLNPRMKVSDIVSEPLAIHRIGTRRERRDRAAELLERVGLAAEHLDRYPHEFSGGQRQRLGIARALALNPKFIVCDEPVSALDVSVQAQVVNLLQDLQEQMGLTYLFISHGLSVVEHISSRVGIMYLGRLVEVAPSREIFHNPLHPYTKALLSAIPVPDPDIKRTRIPLSEDVLRSGTREAADGPCLVEVSPGHLVERAAIAP
ncbi:MAG TPA: ATP-binding cassette domain-containing protein [Blastocatellia bacterium]|jgi:ABC-type oligopeptide transport system ATPase subunit